MAATRAPGPRFATALCALAAAIAGSDAAPAALVAEHCLRCHGAAKRSGGLDLRAAPASWPATVVAHVREQLAQGGMPPARQPPLPAAAKQALLGWADGRLAALAAASAGDPGAVAWRRLTRGELDRAVRDLTGHGLQVSRSLPGDDYGGEGFANVGAVQSALTGPLLDLYLRAFDEVAAHAFLTAEGALAFSGPERASDRVSRLAATQAAIEAFQARVLGAFYLDDPDAMRGALGDVRSLNGAFAKAWQNQKILPRYLAAAWRLRAQREPTPGAIAEAAARARLNPTYLAWVWERLNAADAGMVERRLVQEPFRALPAPTAAAGDPPPPAVQAGIDAMAVALHGWATGSFSVFRGVFRLKPPPPVRVPGEEVVQPIHRPSDAQMRAAIAKPAVVRPGQTPRPAGPQQTHLVVLAGGDGSTGDVVRLVGPRLIASELTPGAALDDGGEEDDAADNAGPAARRRIVALKDLAPALPAGGARWTTVGGKPALECQPPCVIAIPLAGVALTAREGLEFAATVDRPAGGSLIQAGVLAQPPPPSALAADAPPRPDLGWVLPTGSDAAAAARLAGALRDGPLAWGPPHPHQIASFDRERITLGLPREIRLFRDDQRLRERVLDDAQRRELDQLWRYLYLVSDEPAIGLEAFVRDHGVAGLDPAAQAAALERRPRHDLPHPWGEMPKPLAPRLAYYRTRLAEHDAHWRERALSALSGFAARAWRRPLTAADEAGLAKRYDALRAAGGHAEDILRALVVRVLVSPHFLFRVEPVAADGRERALTAWELATRLSLFLWSSLPDDELRRAAADGSLMQPATLAAQAKRLLADPRAEALAGEFFGQWLEFAGFADAAGGPDRTLFPGFTPELRRSMHGEALAFFTDLVRNDRDTRLIVSADYSFLDDRLRWWYGLPGAKPPAEAAPPAPPTPAKPPAGGTPTAAPPPAVAAAFERTTVAGVERGGVLGMGAVLVQTSRLRRTSPVLRGNWVAENLLGIHLPPPPGDVAQIPDQPDGAGLSVRQRLRQHRADPACAGCHARIDPYGFALEAFDAAGRLLPAEARARLEGERLPDGSELAGPAALRAHLAAQQARVQATLARRLLGYALGRAVGLGDQALLDAMRAAAAADGHRFSALVLPIVASRQFRHRRGERESP